MFSFSPEIVILIDELLAVALFSHASMFGALAKVRGTKLWFTLAAGYAASFIVLVRPVIGPDSIVGVVPLLLAGYFIGIILSRLADRKVL